MDNFIELSQLWQVIKKNFWALIFMAIIGAGVGYSIAKFVISPTYSSSTSMLVNRSAEDGSTTNVNLSDQQADVQLISTYKNLITSSNVLGTVSDELAHPSPIVVKKAREAGYKTLADGTNIKGGILANPPQQVADVFKDKIGNFMKISNVSIIDKAVPNNKPVAPNIKLFTFAGFVIFAFSSIIFVLIKELTDTTIKSSDEVVELLGITNLGTISYIKPIKKFSMNLTELSGSENGIHHSRLNRKNRE